MNKSKLPKSKVNPPKKPKRTSLHNVVFLCSINDEKAKAILLANKNLGHSIYEYQNPETHVRYYCIVILHETTYRSPSAIFKFVKSGIYHFNKDGQII
jgi:hypothetical protein